jgi:hypothetical protein
MAATEIICCSGRRRRDARNAPLHGLDFVEVDLSTDHATLQVFFLGKAPQDIVAQNVRITGGRRIRDIRVTDLRIHRQEDPTLDDYVELVVEPAGDASSYTLSLVKLDQHGQPAQEPLDDFDPRYAELTFSFRAGCPTDLDCDTRAECPEPQRAQPDINYLAKDYDSFRQLLLDRLALTMPQWRETHVPDIGIAIVETLAYAGDYLSYYQDAVATEAYLATARQRISVRRHARLVDYSMHEGCNARAWLTIATDTDISLDPRKVFFIAGLPAEQTRMLQPQEYAQLSPGNYPIYDPLGFDRTQPMPLRIAHNQIHFYTWGECACCLPVGATSATLTDSWIDGEGRGEPAPDGDRRGRRAYDDDTPEEPKRALDLHVGDVLIFEEVLGPRTAHPADADPRHRQAVRLTKVTPAIDPLYRSNDDRPGQPIVEIEWCSQDALTFPLCVSANLPPPHCRCEPNVSVARGNVILVDHGQSLDESLGEVPQAQLTEICATQCEPPDTIVVPGRFRPSLERVPLTFGQPLPACGCASELIAQDPRQALPYVQLTGTQSTARGEVVTQWVARRDLLTSGPTDAHFVAEMDDQGQAHLRFGNGDLGRRPEAATQFKASYRIGNGPSGNVGAESIRCIVFREALAGVQLEPRNPLAAVGGTSPESIEEVKRLAPFAFRNTLERAIIAEDYATLAADNARRLARRLMASSSESWSALLPVATPQPRDPRAAIEPQFDNGPDPSTCCGPFQMLQGAHGALRWNGSWYEATVAIDPSGNEDAAAELLTEVRAHLEPFRRIGHDLDVRRARYVPVDLMISICVKPHYQRGHVEAALLEVFGNRRLADGSPGFFHPDRLSFGQDLHVSRIVAAAQAVAGVMEVRIVQLERFDPGEPMPDLEEELPPDGVLELAPFEIARLDNDPSFPENGRLRLLMRGGR